MFLERIFTVITNLFAAQTIDPDLIGEGGGFGAGWTLLDSIGQWICRGVYGVCKWLMAFMDFLQYFIQKLIGLDYWLHTDHYTLGGALKADLLFSFIFDDTVQKTFKAMIGVFVVLLIVFTIFAIIRSEWQYLAGGGKGGQFGDGSNSKTAIIRNALKAIALVIMFPMVMIMGIISSNAILASLVKALNIDTGSTFGAAVFSIASQNANKYKNYAISERKPITDQISFYIGNSTAGDAAGKYIYLHTSDLTSEQYSYGVKDYGKFVNLQQNLLSIQYQQCLILSF